MALGWKIFVTVIAISFTHAPLQAKEIEGVQFVDQLDLGGSNLALNGVGLRTKKRFGMNFKVYVGGLYLPTRSGKPDEILADTNAKLLKMVFLRSLDADTLKEAYEESYLANCKPDCEASREQMNTFKALMTDMKDKGDITIQYDKDSVKVDVNGKQTKSGTIAGAIFRNILLKMYIGEKPPTEDLKRGLLGL